MYRLERIPDLVQDYGGLSASGGAVTQNCWHMKNNTKVGAFAFQQCIKDRTLVVTQEVAVVIEHLHHHAPMSFVFDGTKHHGELPVPEQVS